MRVFPRVRGYGRTSAMLNRGLLRMHASPLVTASMRQGHRLILDARVQSQSRAAFSGNYDNADVEILCGLMKAGTVALDVGANVGFYTVPLGCAARIVGARVIAFEPLPANYRRLVQNVELNGLKDTVELHMTGLSAAAGTAELCLREDFEGGGEVGNASLIIGDGLDARFGRISVDLTPLDDLWPELALASLDIVKIDIEGHEADFLRGAREILERFRPVILMEVNRWFYRRRGMDFDRAIPELLPRGYGFYRLQASRIRWLIPGKVRGIVQVGSLTEFGDVENVFLVPSEKVDELCRIAGVVGKH